MTRPAKPTRIRRRNIHNATALPFDEGCPNWPDGEIRFGLEGDTGPEKINVGLSVVEAVWLARYLLTKATTERNEITRLLMQAVAEIERTEVREP